VRPGPEPQDRVRFAAVSGGKTAKRRAQSECGHLRRGSPGVKRAPRGPKANPARLFAPANPAKGSASLRSGWTPMRALLDVILFALEIYVWLVIAAAILSWLIAFGVVNTRNQAVAMIGDFLSRITEPALRPIRSVMPHLGGIDISPVILILIIILIQRVIAYYIYPYVF
jgi:YggT family protein